MFKNNKIILYSYFDDNFGITFMCLYDFCDLVQFWKSVRYKNNRLKIWKFEDLKRKIEERTLKDSKMLDLSRTFKSRQDLES